MKIDINPQEELLRWGPIDGKLIYPDFFNVAFIKYSKIFCSWPDVLWLGFNEQIIAIVSFPALRESGQKNFKRFILDDKNFNKYYKSWQKNLKELLNFQKEITSSNLKKLTNQQLAFSYKKWSKMYLDFWTIGELPEVANWGGEDILKGLLEKSVLSKDFIFAFERLSAPEDLSFYQRAELDLLKLKKFIKNKKLFEKNYPNTKRTIFGF